METVTHALLGAALCSSTGLAGGRRGPAPGAAGRPRLADWTLPAALIFGVLPDMASIGLHLTVQVLRHGRMGWQLIPDYIFTLYNITHSMLVAGLCVLTALLFSRRLAVTMLAWPLHILTDMLTHGPGRFATPVFYPLSEYRFSGINWWETPWLFQAPLITLAVAWWLILRYRRRNLSSANRAWATDPSATRHKAASPAPCRPPPG